jgi:hypothetical protein
VRRWFERRFSFDHFVAEHDDHHLARMAELARRG